MIYQPKRCLAFIWQDAYLQRLQRQMIDVIQTSRYLVLTGIPGIGKSVVVPFVLKNICLLNEHRKYGIHEKTKICVLEPEEIYCRKAALALARSFHLSLGKDVLYSNQPMLESSAVIFTTTHSFMRSFSQRKYGISLKDWIFVFDELSTSNVSANIFLAWLAMKNFCGALVFVFPSVSEAAKKSYSIPPHVPEIEVLSGYPFDTEEREFKRRTLYMNDCELAWLPVELQEHMARRARHSVNLREEDLYFAVEILAHWTEVPDFHCTCALVHVGSLREATFLLERIRCHSRLSTTDVRFLSLDDDIVCGRSIIYLNYAHLHSSFPVLDATLVIDYGMEFDNIPSLGIFLEQNDKSKDGTWCSHNELVTRRDHCGCTGNCTVVYMFDKFILKHLPSQARPRSECIDKARSLENILGGALPPRFGRNDIKNFLYCFQGHDNPPFVDEFLSHKIRLGAIYQENAYRKEISYHWTLLGSIVNTLQIRVHLGRVLELLFHMNEKSTLSIGILLCGLLEASHFFALDMLDLFKNLKGNESHPSWDIFLVYRYFLTYLTNPQVSCEEVNRQYFHSAKIISSLYITRILWYFSSEVKYQKELETIKKLLDSSKMNDSTASIPPCLHMTFRQQCALTVILTLGYSTELSAWFVGYPPYGRRFYDSEYHLSNSIVGDPHCLQDSLVCAFLHKSPFHVSQEERSEKILSCIPSSMKSLMNKPILKADPHMGKVQLRSVCSSIITKGDHPQTMHSPMPLFLGNVTPPATTQKSMECRHVSLHLEKASLQAPQDKLILMSMNAFYPYSYQWRCFDGIVAFPALMSMFNRAKNNDRETIPVLGFSEGITSFHNNRVLTITQTIHRYDRMIMSLLLLSWKNDVHVLRNQWKSIKAVALGNATGSKYFTFPFSSCDADLKKILKQNLESIVVKYSASSSDQGCRSNFPTTSTWKWVTLRRLGNRHDKLLRHSHLKMYSGVEISIELCAPILHTLSDSINTKRSAENFSEHFLPRLLRRIEIAATCTREFTKSMKKDITVWYFEKLRRNIKDQMCRSLTSIAKKNVLIVEDAAFIVRSEFGLMCLKDLVDLNMSDRDTVIVGRSHLPDPEILILNVLLVQFLVLSTHSVIIPSTNSGLCEESCNECTYSKFLHRKFCCDFGCDGCYPIENFFKDLKKWTILLPPVLPSTITLL